MLGSLYSRLALVLLGLFCLVGLVFLVLLRLSADALQEELIQRLNYSLARDIISEDLGLRSRHASTEVLKRIFSQLMVINPSIELYSLDPQGRILAYSAAPDMLRRQQVDLGPVRAFLSKDAVLPIRGDDPRDPDRRKVFSAAPIATRDGLDGYLYVVLGGEHYDSVARLVEGSYVLRLGAWAFGVSLLFAAIAGLIIFKLLTRRLDRLAAAMQAFEDSGFADQTVPPPTVTGGTRDEIGSLARTFSDMAARMVQQVQQLRQTDNMRRELLANVSHDLRTPMASIQGYLETLLLKDATFTAEERRHHIETALRHSERLGKLVAELFELAKLTREETAIQAEPFSLAELVQDVVQKFQLAADSKGIALTGSFRADLPFVYADIGLIERVLENLIENALRYTPEGGSVRLTLIPGHGTIAVQVSDTGPGIPAEHLPQIFDRYYRVEKGVQARAGSAGLGLAIAKRILDLHGRSISVTSELNVGTTFTFGLPIAAGLA